MQIKTKNLEVRITKEELKIIVQLFMFIARLISFFFLTHLHFW